MRRSAAFLAAPIVVFGAIRVGIAVLRPYAEPPRPGSVVIRSAPLPDHVDRATAKRDAQGKLLFLAHEASAARETVVASAAYDADRALLRDDCAGAEAATLAAKAALAPDGPLQEATESASRAVQAFCVSASSLRSAP